MKKNISIALLALLALGTSVASAQTTNTIKCPELTAWDGQICRPTGLRIPPVSPIRQEIREVRKDIKDTRIEIKDVRKGVRNEAKDIRASTTEARKDIRGEMKDNRDEAEARIKALRASTTEKRAEIKDEQQKKKLEIAKKQAQLIGHRLDAAVGRVQKLADRVSSALDTLTAKGIDVSASRAALADSKIKLDEAHTKIVAVKSAIDTAFASATPKESLKAVEPLVKEASQSIQDAHRSVAKAISSIKPGQNKATTTPTTTSTTTQ